MRREPWFLKFHDLMPFRVREILLVSSAYDAFILEEDGRLDERLFSAYTELSLSAAPRIAHARTAAEGMSIMAARRVDLVISFVRLEDTDAGALARLVKERYPQVPVLLMAIDEADLDRFPGGVLPGSFDRAFLWTGDTRILLAAIKLIEDAKNLDHDVELAGTQVILVVEDKLRAYSTFLATLYAELVAQSHSLIAEGLNDLHRMLRMRARPKIVLCTTFEQALAFFERHRERMLAIISDVRFPRGGREDARAGFELLRRVRAEAADLPVLLQSAEHDIERQTAGLGVWQVAKNTPMVRGKINSFLKEALGFGDFVFRRPDRTEVGRARDLYEMERMLLTVEGSSVEYHASRNHFSIWLNARGMFELATRVRPRTVEEFGDAEALRSYLVQVLRAELTEAQEGVVADFSPRQGGPSRPFVRLGKGSLGGKGRGLAFVSSVFAAERMANRFVGLALSVPKTIVIATAEFDRFLESNAITREQLHKLPEADIQRLFLAAELGAELTRDLSAALQSLAGPLAVRSSSLLEDSRFQPFAGIYATYMLPNNHSDAAVRLREVAQAIKAVFASTFSHNARSYLARTPHSIDDEKMAVVIQEVVGKTHGDRHYPEAAGVAQSYNYYPVGAQKAQDGVALLALGLGHGVVSGGSALRFSPVSPTALPQLASARAFLRTSQTKFQAIDLSISEIDFSLGCESSLRTFALDVAEQDGTLQLAGSVYCPADDALRDSLSASGPRVVSFANVLKWKMLPLAPALAELLSVFRREMGGDVEIEFALDAGPSPTLYVLQIRPMSAGWSEPEPEPAPDSLDSTAPVVELLLCRSERALGHGRIEQVRDVVYVKRGALDGTSTRAAALEVGRINAKLCEERAAYLLIGPGRWGSSDPSLGIPVDWSHITGARVIVETPFDGRTVEPSQGTHFFQNVTSLKIGYLTVGGAAGAGDLVDFEWLDAQTARQESSHVRHVRLAAPLKIRIDGRHGTARIWREA